MLYFYKFLLGFQIYVKCILVCKKHSVLLNEHTIIYQKILIFVMTVFSLINQYIYHNIFVQFSNSVVYSAYLLYLYSNVQFYILYSNYILQRLALFKCCDVKYVFFDNHNKNTY